MTPDDTPTHATDPRTAPDTDPRRTGARPAGARYESRRIPPSGPVSPDGTRPWPNPRHGTGPLIFGGIVLGAAAVTVASLLAVRFIANRAGGGGDDDGGEPVPPRAAEAAAPPHPRGRHHPRGGQRERGRQQRGADAARHPHADSPAADFTRPSPRPVRHRRRRAGGVNGALSGMSTGVGSLLSNITAAMEGFRGVAGEAGSIADEFRAAADKLREILKMGAAQSAAARPADDDGETESPGEDGRHHRL